MTEVTCTIANGRRPANAIFSTKRNIIESVSGICNVYAKSSTVDMYTGAHDAHFIPDHQSNNPSSSPTGNDTMVSMKKSFPNGVSTYKNGLYSSPTLMTLTDGI